MHYLQRSEYDVGCSESGITDIDEALCGYWVLNPSSLWEDQVLLTKKKSP